ncbi:MAG TPA: hypothetical protein V6D15_11725 [Oculatellaceae cyanobacterium]
MNPVEELRHLFDGSTPEDKVEGFCLIEFNVNCQQDADKVLQNCREVFGLVLQQSEKNWLSEAEWYKLLPQWFIKRCSPEMTVEEEEKYLSRWHSLSEEEQVRQTEEEFWSVMEWVSWFEPSNEPHDQRYWYWWDAFVRSPNLLLVVVEVIDVPFPWGSFDWLMKASGAIKVEEATRF